MVNYKFEQEQFVSMINKERNIAHYLVSTPFSSLNNLNYGNKLRSSLFEKEFLVYDGLQSIEDEIIDYLKDISQNTVLITGYQGCGKTTFVNYLAEHLKDSYIEDGIPCSIEKADFEKKDENEKENPFKRILLNLLVRHICEISSSTGNDRYILNFFINNYHPNKNAFDGIEDNTKIQDLFNFLIESKDIDFNKQSEKRNTLNLLLKKLRVPQILTIWSYYIVCKEYVNKHNDFVEVLLLDNIDDIYKNEYTEKFIRGLKKFHEIGSEFISNLRFGENVLDYNLYTNFNFIFCLRDTSAAKFSYHFTTRAVEFFHRDISEKVNKEEVINKKIKYLDTIENMTLKNKANIIKHICNDQYTIRRIFPLYNNDYRKAVKSLCHVLFKYEDYAKEYCKITESNGAAAHFGAHGIILRLILDSFEKQEYFKAIGSYNVNTVDLEEKEKHDLVDYSIPRIILTYLYNYQEAHKDSFLNNLPDTTINLKKLYDCFCKIISPNNIADKLDAMYSLHLKQDWNHLININATYDINSSNINSIFEKYSKGKLFREEDGGIQITCAGRVFVRRITTHYEYFACRYFEDSCPLFLDKSLLKVDNVYVFDKNINDVFSKVKSCVGKAYDFDKKIIKEYYKNDINRFKKSHYLFKRTQTHAERIINHNISYIDAYRHYIIQRAKNIEKSANLSDIEKIINDDKENICKIIINHIKNYVNLMKEYIDKKYFSDSAKNLYDKYTAGIENIGVNYLSDQFISFEQKRGD